MLSTFKEAIRTLLLDFSPEFTHKKAITTRLLAFSLKSKLKKAITTQLKKSLKQINVKRGCPKVINNRLLANLFFTIL